MSRFIEKSVFKKTFFLSVGLTASFILLTYISNNVFADWSSFRGNPQLTGVSESQLPEKLDLLWAFQTGDMIESTAAIVDSTVYLGVSDGNLYAIDVNTGKSTWKYQVEGAIKSSPSVNDGVIYFGDADGVFHAVDITTKREKWKYITEGEIISSANFAADRVLFGSYDGFLYCLNINNGELAWKFETEGYVHATPSVWTLIKDDSKDTVNYAIVTGCDSFLRIINTDDGIQKQQVNLGAYVGASPAISNDHIFCGTYGSEILSVDLDTGDITWRYQHPERQFPFFASAALTNDKIIIGGRDKLVHALSPDRGEPIWTYTAKSRIESSAVIVDQRVFFGTTHGVFIALDINSGKPVWEFATGSSIVASPSVSDGKIYIGTEDGVLYCFGKK